MEFKTSSDFIECWDYCYYRSDETLFGAIRKAEDGKFIFHPARKVIMTCKTLRVISEKISVMNRG